MTTLAKYDSAKAHEYYMRTRKLKGKSKKQKLSKQQTIMKKYINSEISAAKKKALAELKEYYKQEREKIKKQIEALKGQKGKAQIRATLSTIRQNLQKELTKRNYETRVAFENQRVSDLSAYGIKQEKREVKKPKSLS